jgi:GntR family transcriptional regulator, rspAB operon transcriptional repressor
MPETTSLAGEAYMIVRQRILRGDLAIGEVISRRKLAGELGMSFLPVSEALLRLEFEGLLESRPRAGTRVRIPTRKDVEGHYMVRQALEAQSASLYAAVALAEERGELMRLAVRVDAMSSQNEANRFLFLSMHEKLHRRIAECARCPALSEAIEKTHALGSTWLCVTRPTSGEPQTNHQKLMEVLNNRSPRDAGEAMRMHISSSMANAVKRLEPYFRLRRNCGQTYARTSKRHLNIPVTVN